MVSACTAVPASALLSPRLHSPLQVLAPHTYRAPHAPQGPQPPLILGTPNPNMVPLGPWPWAPSVSLRQSPPILAVAALLWLAPSNGKLASPGGPPSSPGIGWNHLGPGPATWQGLTPPYSWVEQWTL